MMISKSISCYGSSSLGNCYLLTIGNERLLIEAGIKKKEIDILLKFDYDISGCLISHEHGDHAKSAKYISDKFIDIVASKGTLDKLKLKNGKNIQHKQTIKAGGFKITGIKANHDAAEPLSFLISHKEMGKLLFVTDTGSFPYNLKGIDHIMIEGNYDDEIVFENYLSGISHGAYTQRLNNTHLSIAKAIDVIKRLKDEKTKTVTLLHLSEKNSDNSFITRVEQEIGVPVRIANKGLVIYLD